MYQVHERAFHLTFHYWLLISTCVGIFILIIRSVNEQLQNFRNNSYSFFFCSILLEADAVHPSSSKELAKRQV